ncbi:MAG: HDIG domain-containing protein [Deltaproteobacteria bacterium]|nr:HDIG domain-containing protein [Deltaproteobacteria bacterium]
MIRIRMEWVSKNKGFLGDFLQKRQLWVNICLLAIFAALASLAMNFSWGRYPSGIRAGAIASRDIRADRDYEIIDEEATEKLRQEKLRGILPVFDWDDRAIPFGRNTKLALKIVADKSVVASWLESGVLINPFSQPTTEPTFFKEWREVFTLEEAKKRYPSLKEIRPNLVLNQKETEIRKEKVLQEIRDVVIKVQRGESIVRKGDRIEPWHVKVIGGIQSEKGKTQIKVRWVGTFGFTFLYIGLLILTARIFPKRFKPTRSDFVFQGVLILLLLMVERIFLYFAGGIRELLPFEAPISAFYVLLPIVAGPMIVRLALSAEAALLFNFGIAALASLLLENSIIYALYFLTGGIAAVWLGHQVKSRAQLMRVGFQVGLLNVGILFMLNLANTTSLGGGIFPTDNLPVFLAFALCGGIASSITTLILLPIAESLFNYITPIKLLEFGSLNHPLLREMIVHAPGTYHHSHMVGTLAEAACEAIGADGLFARVASYFHDIGKLAKPPYFIENQRSGEDRHSTLSPSMSALIITSHVKEGMELAKKYNLPKRIIDIIPQHQGTKLITYFYSKAKQTENPEMQTVDERHYRYPGPKPQTPEAGVILLADTVEASTRALKDRTTTRLEEVVRNMINKNFVDGQLDECELTLKDLEVIGKVFVRILVGIYHQRIEYPELPRAVSSNLSVVPSHVDKYTQPSPLKEDSLSEGPKPPSKTGTRFRPE